MPAVRDLSGLRSALGGSVGVGAGAVADNDRDAGVCGQPRRQGVGAAVGQQVDDAPPFQIAQDGAVAVAFAPGPVVHAKYGHRRIRLGAAGAHTVQQRGATDRHSHGGGVAGAGVAAERQADGPVHRAQAVRLARPRARDAGQRFGEGAPGARGHGTAEAADPDEQNGRLAKAGDVPEAAPVEAVNPL